MKKSLLILCATLAVGLIISSIASAATLNVPGTYLTIKGAVSAASSGDVIVVAAGTYTDEYGIVIDKNLTIQGAGMASTIVRGASIRGAAPDRIFKINSGVTATITGMTIKYGKAKDGANGDSAVSGECGPGTANGCPGEDGGGIYNSGNLILENCFITENDSGNGGVGYVGLPGGTGSVGADGALSEDGSNLSQTSGTAGDTTGNGGAGGNGAYGGIGTPSHPNGFNGGSGGNGGDGVAGQNGGSGGAGGSGGGIFNGIAATLTLKGCEVSWNNWTGASITGGKGGIGGNGAKGGNGGAGGDGGNGGAALTTANTGGYGGAGGKGGDGKNGGSGGSGGNSGSGGGIANKGNISIFACTANSNQCIHDNRAGVLGTKGTGGAKGDKGLAGTSGTGGAPTYYQNPSLGDGADGTAGTAGTDGTPGLGNNVYNDTTVSPNGTIVLLVKLASFTGSATKECITLNWKTLSEIDNAGFHILRSDSEDGDYLTISGLIPAEGSASTAASYSYTDDDVKKGNTYYYKLEAVEYDGDSESYGPVKVTFGKAKVR